MKTVLALFALMLVVSTATAGSHVPTLDELITLKSINGTQISPDGKCVAYTVNYDDLKQDAFVTQICVASNDTRKSLQLTRGEKSSTNPRWSPDGQWLAFLSNRIEDKHQILVIDPNGRAGETLQ